MSAQENKEIALSLFEALNARDLSLWSKHLAQDYIAEHPGVSVPLDKTRGMGYHQRFVTALPNIHFEVLHVLAEGDQVLIHWSGSGAHEERLASSRERPSPDPAQGEGVGRDAHRGEGRQDRKRVVLLGSAVAYGPVGYHRAARTILVS
jgi:predicted SnoaL-like aldol condensation-catalyzing enzyme